MRPDLAFDFKNQAQLQFLGMEIDFRDEIYNRVLIVIENNVVSMGENVLPTLGCPHIIGLGPIPYPQRCCEKYSDINALCAYVDENARRLLLNQRRHYC